ncbi:phosphodiester glycosidase family protein [Dokdonia pacifica]|uniref:Phosphodiester glycosidase domain-containing protein n=1 Tax=Dokdonia pacifica TaxID=1627892 RepID=A0A238YU83_9FLAO|nr:phosphodiester glycosidase family protein [Dokdonia pacifica]SNR74348.1 Predicted protein [Dokdonia pacifica]
MILKKYFFLFVIMLTNTYILKSQIESDTPIFNGKKFDIFKIKLDTNSVKNFSILENNNSVPHNDFIKLLNTDDIFLSTASIVDSNCEPIGLFINNNTLIKNVEIADGTGNFFLKPNGAFLVTDKDVIICQTSEIQNHQNIIFGIQSGPALITNGKIHPAFNPNSQNRHIRSAVGKYKNSNGDAFIVFAISHEEVTFYEIAQFFNKQYDCFNALSIESVRSVMSIPYIQNPSNQSTNIVCRYITYNN